MKHGFWRSALIIARHELADGLRTRRAAVVFVLYVAGAVLAMNGFISALQRMETQIANVLKVPAGAPTGAVVDALWRSHQFQDMVKALVRNDDVAMSLFQVPPVAVVYGWLAFVFTPFLVMLTAPSRISEELGSGSARLVLLRSSRSAWCLGKFMGQAVVVLVALFLSAAGAWCTARFRLTGMNGVAAGVAMALFAARAWVFSFSAVGLALGVSQLTRLPNVAIVLGMIAWIAMRVLAWVANFKAGKGLDALWEGIILMTPHGHWVDLWRPDLLHFGIGAVFLLALGLGYLFAGYAVLCRRDV